MFFFSHFSMAVDSGYSASNQSVDPRLLTLYGTRLGILRDMDGELVVLSVAVL